MSTRGTCGRGHSRGCGGAQARSLSSGHQPNKEIRAALASPMAETGSQNRAAGDDLLCQAMLRILKRIAGPEYWIEATERIMDVLDCTPDQKLKGKVSLLRDETKYVGANYVDARRREFLNLTQGETTVAEYEVEFLRLSRYARGMVAIEYERCVHFEDGLRDGLRVLIAPQRERDFTALMDKAKITEEVTRAERQNREKSRGKRDVEPSNSFQRLRKQLKTGGPIRVRAAAAATTGLQFCTNCGKHHQGECWKKMGTCLRFGSLE
ncbi:uncharacterized protein [Gossypium hirsutum]|uniref:Retrotransposon gag domain-containing protein n=1 Tax=Gossypium hirsutum TaxID=3635 RepID=A0ABM2ZQT6_GOSHI|nr:uncharacterized protein LOC121214790 [Gossypium hirsutum]